jgi:hypothetical protein
MGNAIAAPKHQTLRTFVERTRARSTRLGGRPRTEVHLPCTTLRLVLALMIEATRLNIDVMSRGSRLVD